MQWIVVHEYFAPQKIPALWYTVHTAKQIGYFNHRVVTMAADKLKREWFTRLLIA